MVVVVVFLSLLENLLLFVQIKYDEGRVSLSLINGSEQRFEHFCFFFFMLFTIKIESIIMSFGRRRKWFERSSLE